MRCSRRKNLEVHHRRRDGGDGFDNAEVLCQECHEATGSYGSPGESPPAFSDDVRDMAMELAGYQCQCTRVGGCH